MYINYLIACRGHVCTIYPIIMKTDGCRSRRYEAEHMQINETSNFLCLVRSSVRVHMCVPTYTVSLRASTITTPTSSLLLSTLTDLYFNQNQSARCPQRKHRRKTLTRLLRNTPKTRPSKALETQDCLGSHPSFAVYCQVTYFQPL